MRVRPGAIVTGTARRATALYVKLHGSEQGLGDVFLKAWDRAAAALHDRIAHYQAIDPNYDVSDVLSTFTFLRQVALRPITPALDMAKLKGKTWWSISGRHGAGPASRSIR